MYWREKATNDDHRDEKKEDDVDMQDNEFIGKGGFDTWKNKIKITFNDEMRGNKILFR